MPVHSKFIVHWAGKEITKHPPLSASDSQSYIALLRKIMEGGLLMKIGSEVIHGRLNRNIEAKIARACFTEIKLSEVKDHAFKYGLLGIGFDRQFICERYGNPVFYVQNHLKYGVVIETLDPIIGYLQRRKNDGDSEAEKMIKFLEIPLCLMKGMSEKTNSTEYDCYDEMEWRIIHLGHMEEDNMIQKKDDNYYLKFSPSDIKLLVFPDTSTKGSALNDDRLKDLIFSHHLPIITTIDECEHF